MKASEIVARRSGGLLLSLLFIFIAGINFSFNSVNANIRQA